MAHVNLEGLKVAILVDDGFEQVELVEPRKALDQAGAETRVVSPKGERVRGWDFTDCASAKHQFACDSTDSAAHNGRNSNKASTASRELLPSLIAARIELMRLTSANEWCVVLRNSFEHLAFDHVPGLEHRIVLLRPAFA
jgi:putative intracellular protease/amidase